MHRYTYLEKDVSLANSGERTVDIKMQDPITALFLEMRCANGASHNQNNPIHATIDAVEIIDGSTVLWSLDGFEMLGMVCGQLGFMPHQRFSELPGDVATLSLPILFGSFIGDTVRSFDPLRFLNPQVRIKWNLANLQAVGAGGFADEGLTMTLIAVVMEGAPKPSSLLKAHQHYTYTAAAGIEYRDLPRDHPYKAMMIRAVATTSHWYEVISNLKLDLDGGSKVPLDLATEDLQYLLFMRQPRLECRQVFWQGDAGTIYPVLKEVEHGGLISESGTNMDIGYYNYEYGQQTIDVYSGTTVNPDGTNIGASITGFFPYHCVYIPFGDPLNPAEWFQAQQYGSVRLELTGLLARSIYICLLQDLPY